MKKIFFILALCTALACLNSCKTENADSEEIATPVFYLSADVDETIVLAEGRSKSVKLNVKAEKTGPASNITFTIAADNSLISDYNTNHSTDYVEMPPLCYSFDKTSLTVSRYGVNSTTCTLKITANSLEQGKTYILPIVIASAEGADYKMAKEPNAYVLLKAADVAPEPEIDITDGLVDDECKPADPSRTPDYIINNLEDMKNLRNNLKKDATTYVVLNDNIDMSSVTDWEPLFSSFNNDGTDLIEFNGKGHTISNFTCSNGSYRSFFGFLSGRVYDVNFENATVDGTASGGTQPCAIVAAYGGNKTGNSKCAIYDVNVKGGDITGKAGGVGGIVGVAVNAIIKRCSFDGTIVNNGRRQGGIAGYHNVQIEGAYLRIEDCWTSGSISGTQQVAGILGQTQFETAKNGFNTGASVVKNCYSTMEVVATRNAAGICGTCSYGGSYHNTELDITKDMIIGCIAWNDKVEATGTTTGNYSSAPVVGYCNIYQYFQNCRRKADMDFRCPVDQLGEDGKTVSQEDAFSITAIDQENSSPDLSMLAGTAVDEKCPYSYKYAYPYHGKAATPGATVSSLARELKWNESVWDLSGEYPVLK